MLPDRAINVGPANDTTRIAAFRGTDNTGLKLVYEKSIKPLGNWINVMEMNMMARLPTALLWPYLFDNNEMVITNSNNLDVISFGLDQPAELFNRSL